MGRNLLILLGVGVTLILAAIWQRHYLMVQLIALEEPPALLDTSAEGVDAVWFDDYFLIEAIDERTFAIGEPLYYQQNFSYLIVGDERAVLFDAGPGIRDIRAAAESLTELPITFVPSHFHYDHTGNRVTFDQVAVVDLPYLRQRAVDNQLSLLWFEHLGESEGVAPVTLDVDEWLPIGSVVSLGGRDLQVLYTPGHTTDSISLLDLTSGAVFAGDFIYPGPLYAFLPNSSLGEYLTGADNLVARKDDVGTLYTAHRLAPPGIPTLGIQDVLDLQHALKAIRDGQLKGEGVYPVSYPVNERIQLLSEPTWLQRWSPPVASSND